MTIKRFALYGAATLTALTLASCGGEEGEAVPAPDISVLANDCATSKLANTPSGGGNWAPTELWDTKQDGKNAVATGWYKSNGIGKTFPVTCHIEYQNAGWIVTAVEVTQHTIGAEDLTEEQVAALTAAYGAGFDPNSLYHLHDICSRDIHPDTATAQDLDGAKIMCPRSILTDGASISVTPTTTAAAPPAKASFSDGTHMVGTDIQPGTYRSSGSGMCYWERLSGFGGQLEDIIANENPSGQTIVTIATTDVAFKSQRCGMWEMVE